MLFLCSEDAYPSSFFVLLKKTYGGYTNNLNRINYLRKLSGFLSSLTASNTRVKNKIPTIASSGCSGTSCGHLLGLCISPAHIPFYGLVNTFLKCDYFGENSHRNVFPVLTSNFLDRFLFPTLDPESLFFKYSNPITFSLPLWCLAFWN